MTARGGVAFIVFVVLSLAVGLPGEALARKRPPKRGGKTSPTASPASIAAEGRAHIKRANALAGEGNCEDAIWEYTTAYDQLGDPVVLFNRGECYRRLGNKAKAVEDYRAFLQAVPTAPNKADIEAKITALDRAVEPPSDAPHVTGAAAESAASRSPAPAPTPAEPAPAAVVVDVGTTPALVATGAPVDEPATTRRFWIWTGVAAAVVVGGAAAGYFLFKPDDVSTPGTALGHYRF